MKYLKTYEAKVGYYPNTTDKQYWIYYTGDNNHKGEEIIYLLKFIKYDGKYNGEYIFEAITLTSYNDYNIGDRVPKDYEIEPFSFYESGIRQFQQNDKLRLATPEEIELSNMYSQQNKYNL
jgi:hypothetical protein